MYASISGRLRIALAGLALIATALVATGPALGQGVASLESPAPEAAASPPASEPMDAMIDYAACMREQGIDMPDPEVTADGDGYIVSVVASGDGGQPGADPERFRAAEETCREHLEAMDPGRADAPIDPEVVDGLLAYAACMREHGVDMPDPDVSGGTVRIAVPVGEGLDTGPEAFQEATEACRGLSPMSIGGAPIGEAP